MLACMDRDFSDWLARRLEERRINQRELAQMSGVSAAQISRIMAGMRRPGEEALNAIALALHLPAAQVFRAAGILPAEPKADPLTEEGLHILQQLEGEDKVEALRYLRLRLDVAEQRGSIARKRRAQAA